MRRTLTPSNSPMSSPSKHGDRFIPSRAGANWSINFHRINVSFAPFSYSSALELRKWYLLFWLAWLLCLSFAPWASAAPESFECVSSNPVLHAFAISPYTLRFLYGDGIFLHFRKMKNHQAKTEKQRMLHQTVAKVRAPFYRSAVLRALIANCWGNKGHAGVFMLMPKLMLVFWEMPTSWVSTRSLLLMSVWMQEAVSIPWFIVSWKHFPDGVEGGEPCY